MFDYLVEHATMIGLLCFFAAFVGIGVWAYMPQHKKELESHANIPFKE